MTPRRHTFAIIAGAAVAASGAGAQTAQKETIAVIGTGTVGRTMGKLWAKAGHRIIYGSRTPDDPRVKTLVADTGNGATVSMPKAAAAGADIVLLGVPYPAAEEAVKALGDLTGKIIIEPMNNIKVADNYPLPNDKPVSVAEQVQAWAPGALVVKALNTLPMSIVEDPRKASGPVSIPLSGNDKAAKARVAALISAVGLKPIDVGPLFTARYVEDMYRLYSGFRRNNPGKAFDYNLQIRDN